MFASIVHEKVLEIWRAGGENHLVAFERSSFHSQGDITKSLNLVRKNNVRRIFFSISLHHSLYWLTVPEVTDQKHSVSWTGDYSISDKIVDRPFCPGSSLSFVFVLMTSLSSPWLPEYWDWVPASNKVFCCLSAHIIRLLKHKIMSDWTYCNASRYFANLKTTKVIQLSMIRMQVEFGCIPKCFFNIMLCKKLWNEYAKSAACYVWCNSIRKENGMHSSHEMNSFQLNWLTRLFYKCNKLNSTWLVVWWFL